SDLRLWSAAGKLVLDLLVRQRYLPGATRLADPAAWYGYPRYNPGPRVASFWYAAFSDPADRTRFDSLAAAMPALCRAGVSPGTREPSYEQVPGPVALLEDFAHCIVNARVAHWLTQDRILLDLEDQRHPGVHANASGGIDYGMSYGYNYGYHAGYGYPPSASLTARWMWGLMAPNRQIYTTGNEADTLLSAVERWHAGLSGAGRSAFRLCFRLAPPEGWRTEATDAPPADADASASADASDTANIGNALPQLPRLVTAAPATPTASNGHQPDTTAAPDAAVPDAAEGDSAAALAAPELLDASGRWRVDYLLQARDDLSLSVPLEAVWKERGATAHFLDRRFDHPHAEVLASLGQAARLFAPIDASLHEAHPVGCDLSGGEAYLFLREAAPLLEEAGFGVLVPGWWKRTTAKPTVRLRVKGMKKTSSGMMGLDAVVAYDWKLALGGAELTQEELERLAALKEPLVRLRGQWVELQPDQVDAALRFMAAHANGKMSLGDVLGASLTGEVGDGEIEIEEVTADEWIGDLLGRLRGGEALAEVPSPET
ncbi:MAG TPA: SNF2 helicase-associated domain-containing protein, partial [Ktedonobacterales bacterium]|nr:SNF2 helicase-associated domain-containing protein [Ktedonobacterales bacterium]